MHIGLKSYWSPERLPVCLSLALFHTDRFNRGDRVAFGMLWVDQHIDRLSQFHKHSLWYIAAELVRRICPGSVHSAMITLAVPVPAAQMESVILAMIRVPCCFNQRVLLIERANKPMPSPIMAMTTIMTMIVAHICCCLSLHLEAGSCPEFRLGLTICCIHPKLR
jgi:hypothetical protein